MLKCYDSVTDRVGTQPDIRNETISQHAVSHLVVWRAGLDLSPINLEQNDDLAWLETLIWPGEDASLARFRTSIEIAVEIARRENIEDCLPVLRTDAARRAAHHPPITRHRTASRWRASRTSAILAEGPMVRRLFAGGRWIRTRGPAPGRGHCRAGVN
jgi:hypothetical protein